MISKKKLARVAEVTTMEFHAKQGRLRLLQDHADRQREHLAELNAAKSERGGEMGHDAALAAGVDLLWHQWVDQRRSAINADILRTEHLMDIERKALARAFGRDRVASELLKRAHKS